MNFDTKNFALALCLKAAKSGTFTGLVIKKVGKMAGRGADKKRYGDALVHVTMVTGFKYRSLCTRSLTALDEINAQEVLDYMNAKGIMGWQGRGAKAVQVPITLADINMAIEEIKASLALSETGDNTASTDHVYETLTVDGQTVNEGRVYRCVKDNPDHECKCRTCNPEDEKAPLDGTIYLKGLKLQETVLEEAPNGYAPRSKSAPKIVAKNIIKSRLPIGRFVSYRLEPGQDWILNAGGAARLEMTNRGITLDPSISALIDAA